MSSRTILLVEDEPGLVLTLSDLLQAGGWIVIHRGDYKSANAAVKTGLGDLVILDIMLPGGSGLDILKDMRERGDNRPVLMLTARATVPERVQGLKQGADDYLPKPFDSTELLARLEALSRRSAPQPVQEQKTPGIIRFGDIEIETGRAEVRKDGLPLPLTVQEYRLLVFLANHPGKTVSRQRLLEKVWGYDSDVESRTVDVHVSSLRQKLGDDPSRPRWIVTVRGFGYRLEL